MEILNQFGVVPIDYGVLASELATYKSPRQKIVELEKEGAIIRLKRGMYVVSPKISGKLLSIELIANHIYGPSYVSMESALRYYGLIPEKTYNTDSMTIKRSRKFDNAIARFNYTYCPASYYTIGVEQVMREGFSFLIASPEKALCDVIIYTPQLRLRSMISLQEYLADDLRLDMDEFFKMDISVFEQCAAQNMKSEELNNIIKLLRQ